jgi:cyanophycin synthetase
LGHGIYQFGWGKNAVRLHRSVTEHDSALAMVVCQQKILTCEWLGKEGFPVTQPLRAETLEDAVLAARQLGWPVVIKPIDADRCEGVTLGINSETAVKEATLHALQFGSRQLVLVEQQVKGQCHRLFVANGTLLYAIERKPLELIGDGLKTLHQLIDEYNDALRWSHEKPVIFDEAMSDHLALQGIDANQILKNEKSVTLHPFDSPIWGGTDIDRTDEIHPENLSLAEAVAASLGLDVAGIDFITPDIRIPWHQNNAQVIEVNFAPMLGMWPISEGYLPTFFERYCKNRGQIPFHWINGDSEVAWQRGLIRQKLRWNQGSPSYLVSELMTLRPDGTVLPRVLKSLRERVFALLLSREVEEVIVVTEFSTENPLADLVNHWDTVECIRSKSNGISGAV